MSPMKEQVGGTHYSKHPMQPFEYTMANGWDALAHTILKYVHRHTDKGGIVDLRKALHCTDLRDHLKQPVWKKRGFSVWNSLLVVLIGTTVGEQDDPRIAMEVYVSMNRIPEEEAEALYVLERWVRSQEVDQRKYPVALKKAIRAIMLKHYGVEI